MDYTQFIIPATIIVYAVFEYQRREQVHRERMELLKRDIEPQPLTRQPNLTTIATTATVTVLLLAISIFFSCVRYRSDHFRGCIIFAFLNVFYTNDISNSHTEARHQTIQK
jgi:high-affinity K+ transport system ATPase subunit B